MRWFYIYCLSLLTGLSAYAEPTTVVLQTHLQPPYQTFWDSKLGGTVPATLECVFLELGRPYVISLAPRKRNRELIKQNRIDGFFLSIPDSELDQYSVASDPLALERWQYYSLKKSNLPARPDKQKVGAILGSNEKIWLHGQGLDTEAAIPNMDSLAKLLAKERIKYALADEKTFERALRENGLTDDVIHRQFVKYVPLVTYFSKDFLKANPDFLRHFNLELKHCVKDRKRLQSFEHAFLLERAKKWLHENLRQIEENWQTLSDNSMSIREKRDQDAKWYDAASAGGSTLLMDQILANHLSAHLRHVSGGGNGVSEVFVTDDQGFIVSSAQKTSDYWQGDEAAFLSLTRDQKEIHVSDISFDHSGRRFQVQVSLPLKDKKSDRLWGMVTIGFDPNLALGKLTQN